MTPGLLTLTQWLSPAFPLGSFAYSHGLEAAMIAGKVRNAKELQAWLEAVLEHGSGRSDAILLALALRGEDPAELDALARALAASRERAEETLDQGAAFIRTTNALTGKDLPSLALPVAAGLAARPLKVGAEQAAAFYLQSFAGTLIQAAVRFLPLGQTEGQAALTALQPLILRCAAVAAMAGRDELGTGALASDLAAMQHEGMEVRIFRT